MTSPPDNPNRNGKYDKQWRLFTNSNTHCRWCSGINCSNSKNKRSDLPFFHFPMDPEICKKWVINTRRADLDKIPVERLHKSYFLCADHFEACCFSKTAQKRKRLVKGALPTIFAISKPPRKICPARPPPKQRLSVVVHTDDRIHSAASAMDEHSASASEQPRPSTQDTETAPLKRKLCTEHAKIFKLTKRVKLQLPTTTTSGEREEALDLSIHSFQQVPGNSHNTKSL